MLKRSVIIACSLIVGLLAADAGQARDREISVTGTCVRQVTADRGAVTLTAQVVNDDLKTAIRLATQAYEKTLADVKRLNLEALDIQTAEYSAAEWKEWENKRSVFKGYRARMGMRVTSASIQRLGEVIAVAAKEGLTDVGQLTLFVSAEKALQERLACLEQAAENARIKARRLAKALDATIGEAVAVSEEQVQMPSPRPLMAMQRSKGLEAAGDDIGAPSIEAGEQELSVTVQVVFSLR
jgi:uncharacterized protein YggE